MLCLLAFHFATDQDDNVEELSEALRVTPEWKKILYLGMFTSFFFIRRSLGMSHTIFERSHPGVKKAIFVLFFFNIKLQKRFFLTTFQFFHEITGITKYIF